MLTGAHGIHVRQRSLTRRLLRAAATAGFATLVGCAHHSFVTRAKGAPNSFVIRGVRVFDSPRAVLLEGLRDVVVRDGRIAAVELPGTPVTALAEVDGKGGTLLPGLVDAHTHTGGSSTPPWAGALPDTEENLGAFLYAGVTTVLDLGSLTPAVFELREKIRGGSVLGPHLYAAGPMITAPGGHPVGILRKTLPWWVRWYALPRATREVATAEAAKAAVETLLAAHPDVLKVVIDAIPPLETRRTSVEVAAAIVAAGHAGGVRSVAHIGRSADAIDAIHAGIDVLAHGVYREEMSEEAVAAVAAARIPVMPTIAVFDAAEVLLATRPPDYLAIEREIAKPQVLAAFFPVPASYDRAPLDQFVHEVSAAHEARRKNVVKLRSAGVTILAGSDACNPGDFPGAGLHVELRKLVEAGLSPGEALRAATYENAHFLEGAHADFGEIVPGQRADLVLIAADPVADIAAIDRIESVFLEGVRLDRHPRRGVE